MERSQSLSLSAAGRETDFAAGLPGISQGGQCKTSSARLSRLSGSHWGYRGPDNPDAAVTLSKTLASVKALEVRPDFIAFTGNLTHTTGDPGTPPPDGGVDFMHGFIATDFGIRVDPGEVTKVRLRSNRLGRVSFLCDNFYADNHSRVIP
jgi:hypothetical protein